MTAYRDNITDALPVLEAHNVPLAIYISPGLIDRRVDLWWDVSGRHHHALQAR